MCLSPRAEIVCATTLGEEIGWRESTRINCLSSSRPNHPASSAFREVCGSLPVVLISAESAAPPPRPRASFFYFLMIKSAGTNAGVSSNQTIPDTRESVDYPQTEVLGECIEIPVVVQQFIPALDASGCNHRIDGLADSYTVLAQDANILRRLNGNFLSAQLHHRQRGQHSGRGPLTLERGPPVGRSHRYAAVREPLVFDESLVLGWGQTRYQVIINTLTDICQIAVTSFVRKPLTSEDALIVAARNPVDKQLLCENKRLVSMTLWARLYNAVETFGLRQSAATVPGCDGQLTASLRIQCSHRSLTTETSPLSHGSPQGPLRSQCETNPRNSKFFGFVAAGCQTNPRPALPNEPKPGDCQTNPRPALPNEPKPATAALADR